MRERRFGLGFAVLVVASTLGPVLVFFRRLLRTAAPQVLASPGPERFVYDFVLLVWLPQWVATFEQAWGTPIAVGSAVFLNAVLYVGVGAMFILLDKRWRIALVLAVGAAITLLSALIAGFDLRYSRWDALALALFFYAVTFWLTSRVVRSTSFTSS